jgi:hypothetical protein
MSVCVYSVSVLGSGRQADRKTGRQANRQTDKLVTFEPIFIRLKLNMATHHLCKIQYKTLAMNQNLYSLLNFSLMIHKPLDWLTLWQS